MKSTKKVLMGICLLSACILFSACGDAQTSSKVYKAKLAHVQPPVHAISKACEQFAAEVEEKSNGRLIITVFPAGQLGSEKDAIDGMGSGIVQFAVSGPGEVSKRYTPLMVLEAPFIFNSFEKARQVLDGEIGDELAENMLRASNIRILDYLFYGSRQMTTSKIEIHSPSDMKGMKLRCPDNPLYVNAYRALGCIPTPMTLSEVYLALQQGVVDGQENPVSTIETQKFFEVQKYMTLTSHIMSFQQFFVSESFYSTLPEDLKAIVDEAAVNMKKLNDSIIVDAENTTTDRLRENGLTVVELTDEGRQAFSSLIIPVITKQYAPEWDGFYEKIIEAQQ